MIFATVGTTRFDELVEAMDKIAPKLNEEVVIQIGNVNIYPRTANTSLLMMIYSNTLRKQILLLLTAAAGITFEVLNLGKEIDFRRESACS